MDTKTHLLTITLSLALLAATTAAGAASSATIYKNYLRKACNSTTYPKLCYKYLSSYSSTIKTNDLTLCSTALNVSLQFATNTSAYVYYVSKQKGLTKTETQVVQDCLEEIGDSIDELSQSFDAFCHLDWNSSDLRFQISNVQTWVSAAITDENTCMDGFDDGSFKVRDSVKKKIRKVVLNLAMVTSNALALINKLHVY